MDNSSKLTDEQIQNVKGFSSEDLVKYSQWKTERENI
jgi:hypothetical protein